MDGQNRTKNDDVVERSKLLDVKKILPQIKPFFKEKTELYLERILIQCEQLLEKYWIPNAREKCRQTSKPIKYLLITESPPEQKRENIDTYFYAHPPSKSNWRPSIQQRSPLKQLLSMKEDRGKIQELCNSGEIWTILANNGFLVFYRSPCWTDLAPRF